MGGSNNIQKPYGRRKNGLAAFLKHLYKQNIYGKSISRASIELCKQSILKNSLRMFSGVHTYVLHIIF